MIYIPEKIVVGFQNRTDTFDGKLSYIIYYDEKGVLRKEKSWNTWRDKNIDSIELKNEPFKAPYLNKGIHRTGYSFSSGRSMLRVYDPRGFEYEITIPNFVGITQYCDLIKGEFEGEFVYAFEGADLILLPVDSEQYKKAKADTDNKKCKVSAKDLVPGQAYKANNGTTCIYIGKYNLNKAIPTRYAFNLQYKSAGVKPVFYSCADQEFKQLSLSSLGEVKYMLSDKELQKCLNAFVGSRFEKKVEKLYIEPINDIEKFKVVYDETRDTFVYLNGDKKVLLGKENNGEFEGFNFLFPYVNPKRTNTLNGTNIHCCTINFSISEAEKWKRLDTRYFSYILDKSSKFYNFLTNKNQAPMIFDNVEKLTEFLNEVFIDILKTLKEKNVGIVYVKYKDGSVEEVKHEGQNFNIKL